MMTVNNATDTTNIISMVELAHHLGKKEGSTHMVRHRKMLEQEPLVHGGQKQGDVLDTFEVKVLRLWQLAFLQCALLVAFCEHFQQHDGFTAPTTPPLAAAMNKKRTDLQAIHFQCVLRSAVQQNTIS